MSTIFILQCKEELRSFKAVTCEVDMPVIDIDEAVQVIMEALEHEDSEKTIHRLVRNIAHGERLMEQEDDDSVTMRLYAASLRLACAIRNKLYDHHAYVDGHFPFTFQKFISDDTFYLRRKQDVP